MGAILKWTGIAGLRGIRFMSGSRGAGSHMSSESGIRAKKPAKLMADSVSNDVVAAWTNGLPAPDDWWRRHE